MTESGVDLHPCCLVLELRQYTLHPGGRDILAELFARHFLDAHAALGMHVPGLFADLDDPDRLVWLRGFTDMRARRQALSDFYRTGEVWREHAAAANATMIDSDDVLLLRPVYVGSGYPGPDDPLHTTPTAGELVIDINPLTRLPDAAGAPEAVAREIVAAAEAEGAEVLVVALTHPEPNDFPALPVRDEQVAVWLLRYPTPEARDGVTRRLEIRTDDEQVRLRALPGSQIA